jgi:DNA-binding transcriptional LysR family regulator
MWRGVPDEIDIRMLRVLHLLLTYSSVTQTAKHIKVTQSSVSQTLQKWRTITGDQLLIRNGSSLIKTEYASLIAGELSEILSKLDSTLHNSSHLKIDDSKRTVNLVVSPSLELERVVRVLHKINALAKTIRVHVYSASSENTVSELLETGEADLSLSEWKSPPPKLRCELIRSTKMVFVHKSSKGQHLKLNSPEKLIAVKKQIHVNSGRKDTSIDTASDRTSVTVESLYSVPDIRWVQALLQKSDMVFATSLESARELSIGTNLEFDDPLSSNTDLNFYMSWHNRMHDSAFGRWLREVIRKEFAIP